MQHSESIKIILDIEDRQNPIFVEIEDNQGKSISIGKWDDLYDDTDGRKWASITITAHDIIRSEKI